MSRDKPVKKDLRRVCCLPRFSARYMYNHGGEGRAPWVGGVIAPLLAARGLLPFLLFSPGSVCLSCAAVDPVKLFF